MHPSEKQSELITHLFTLFIRCPFGLAAGNCPFADIRALQSLELKFRLAEQMAGQPNCHKNVRNTHEACYRTRLQQVVKPCRRRISTASATQRAKPPLHDQAVMDRR